MNRNAHRVFNQVAAAWTQMTVSMQQMYQSSNFRPGGVHEVFTLDETAPDEEVKFNIGPVVFNVPEKIGRGQTLFIVVKGWLSFGDGDLAVQPLKTKSFGTEVGYFRLKDGFLEHVYGVHYDLDEVLPGHPVFHAQLSSRTDMAQTVHDLFRVEGELKDFFKPKLKNIRIPTAQMDVFSAILQICADHLIYKDADATVHKAFSDMCATNSFFLGAAHRMNYLSQPPANECYRSAHWYTR
jgi:hypothetical protein